MDLNSINSFLSLFKMKILCDINNKKSYIYNNNDKVVGKLFINSKGVLSVNAVTPTGVLTAKIHIHDDIYSINYLLKHNNQELKLSGGLVINGSEIQNSIAIIRDGSKILKL